MKELIAGIGADAAKFYNRNNVAACTRVRKTKEGLQVLASETRK